MNIYCRTYVPICKHNWTSFETRYRRPLHINQICQRNEACFSYIAAIVFLRTNYICKKKNKSENLVGLTRFQFLDPFTDFLAVGHTWKFSQMLMNFFGWWIIENSKIYITCIKLNIDMLPNFLGPINWTFSRWPHLTTLT